MKMVASKVVQLFYRSDGEPMEVYPHFCFDGGMINALGAPCLSNGLTLLEQMKRKPDSKVCFCRTFALGDILVLTPIFNWLKDEYPACQIVLATSPVFLSLFRYWDAVETIEKRMILHSDYDIGYCLDGIVEQDHQGDEKSYKHRTDIYCEFLGIPVPKDPIFSLPYGEDEKQWAEGIIGAFREPEKPVVVVQLSGTMWFNSFPFEKAIRIGDELSKVCSVIMVHNFKQDIKIKGICNLTGQTTFHEAVALIDSADVAVTMDSGPLWIAHCTKTPIIAMFGHTRAKEKMVHHRNYHSIDLAEMVGCESCFGRPTKCNGAADCLTKSDEKEITKRIRDGIRRFVYE